MEKFSYPDCLKLASLEIVGTFSASNKHHDIRCMICGNIFNATPKSKMNNFKEHGIHGCPRCTMDKRFQQEKLQMQQKIKELGFVVTDFRSKLDDIIATNTNCSCGRSWKTKPTYLLSERSFCKPCNDENKAVRMKSFNDTRSEQSLKKIDDFAWYKKVVNNMSNTNYDRNIESFPLKRGFKNHLDHIIPISYCFRNKIPPEVCAAIDNLRVIPANQNLRKNINITTKIPNSMREFIPENINILEFKNTIKNLIPGIIIDADIGEYNYNAYDQTNKIVFHIFENSKMIQQIATRSSMNSSKKNLNDNGIKSFFFYEDEWIEKKNIILDKVKYAYNMNTNHIIHARKCELREVTAKDKKIFLDANHLLGSDRANISYGAYFNNELVALMSFSKPKIFMKGKPMIKQKYELSRFCIKGGYVVTGIASRLLNKFKQNIEFDELYSFADCRVSNGDMYAKLGFTLKSKVDLDYCYLIDGKRYHRWNYRKDMIKEKYPQIYDETKKEYQMMIELGYDRIWDCGKLKFTINN